MLAGLAATLVALLAVSSWLAIGSLFQRDSEPGDARALGVALLAGSGLTAGVFTAAAWLGTITIGVLGVTALAVVLVVIRRHQVAQLMAGALAPYKWALPGRTIYLAGVPAAAVLWLNAIAPPRDADSMRYHLAHIRQIVWDGGWKPIRDYHYAFPFGWTLNYLPFELLHLPQAAQLVNAFLLVAMLGGILRILRVREVNPAWTMLAVALVAHPFVLRTFTSPNVDGYAIFVVFTLCALLLLVDEMRPRDAVALGFVSWIGAQSRYQLVAVAIAALIAILVFRPVGFRRLIAPYLAGALAAMALSAPFYLANLATFGNPVWPLAIGHVGAASSYVDQIGAAYTRSLSGTLSPGTVWWGIKRMSTTLELVPIPIVIVLLLVTGLKSGWAGVNRLVTFGIAFLGLWIVAQPRLYPRFILLLLPVGALLGGLRFGKRPYIDVTSKRWMRRYGAAITMTGFTAVFAATSLDEFRYAATGNLAEYHRFTWFYPVYMWANRTLPQDSRLLVIVYSGHSYYLERQYRRADPWLSAEIDWQHVTTASALDSALSAGRYDYVIYDNRDWSSFPGGARISTTMKRAVGAGMLVPIHSFRVPLYSSRVRRRFELATVYIFARAKSKATGMFAR